MDLTLSKFAAATGLRKPLAERWHPVIWAACQERYITTPARLAAFLANAGHETASFTRMREIWGPTPDQLRYERDFNAPWPTNATDAAKPEFARNRKAWSLGNSEVGDGRRFCGHGIFQITGRFNHALCAKALVIGNLLTHPEQLEEPVHAARSAAWYWDSRKLNALADAGDFKSVVKRINGGTKGYDDRMARWLTACAALEA